MDIQTSKSTIRGILGLVVLVVHIIETESGAAWIRKSELTIKGSIVTCGDVVSSYSSDEYCEAMWKEGENMSQGEHYWTIYFDKVDNRALVGLATNDSFNNDLLYGENWNFGRKIESGDTIGLLASFSYGNLRVFIDHNSKTPELHFEAESTELKNIFPAVKFFGPGRALISKERIIPSERYRKCTADTRNFVGVEGNWRIATPGSMTFGGFPFRFYAVSAEEELRLINGNNIANLNVKRIGNTSKYEIFFRVLNSIWFNIKDCDGAWSSTPPETTLLVGHPELMDLENKLKALLATPDSFTISGAIMTLRKGNMVVTFIR